MPGKILGLDINEDSVTAVQVKSGLKGYQVTACGRVMIDGLCMHGPDETEVVDNLGRVGKQVADPRTGCAAPRESKDRRRHREALLRGSHGRQALTFAYRVGEIFPTNLRQLRFVVKQVDLRRGTRLEKINDASNPWRIVRHPRQHICRSISPGLGGQHILGRERCQRRRPQPQSSLT